MPFLDLTGNAGVSYDVNGALLNLPPVPEPPAGVTFRQYQHVMLHMPDGPALDEFGWPIDYDVTEEGPQPWGGFQIVITGEFGFPVDVTFYRGIPTLLEEFSFSEPFADETATIRFPQISAFEELPSWLGSWNNVDIVSYSGEVLWEGLINSVTWSEDGVLVECLGVLHQGELYVRAPGFLNTLTPIAYLLRDYAFNKTYRPAYRFATLAIETGTPIQSRYRGSWESPLNYAQRLLEQAINEDGAYSIRITRPRSPVFILRDTTTEHWSVAFGQPGVKVNVRKDFISEVNVLYAEGEGAGGATWRGVFRDPTNGQPRIQPVAYNPAVHGFDEIEQVLAPGELLGTLRYDAARATSTQIRIEQYHNLGSNYDRADAKARGAESIERSADAGYAGTITLNSDPMEGVRWEMKAGDNIRVKNMFGEEGILFHISGCTHNPLNNVTTLRVDSKARDLATVEALLGHYPEAYDPYLAISDGRSAALINDRTFPWDETQGSGQFPGDTLAGFVYADPDARITVPGQTWHTFAFLASEKDSIKETHVFANEDEDGEAVTRRFHVEFYNREPDTSQLPDNPLEPNVWNEWPKPDGFQNGWGYEGPFGAQAAGYSPGLEGLGSPQTGVLIDNSIWQYDHADVDPEEVQPAFLWCAIWIDHEDITKVHGRLVRGIGTT